MSLQILITFNMENFFRNYHKKEMKPLDEMDIRILYFIHFGIRHCTHIASFLEAPKQTISTKVAKMAKMGYIESVGVEIKHFYKEYVLSEAAKQLINSISPSVSDFNLLLLYSRMSKMTDS